MINFKTGEFYFGSRKSSVEPYKDLGLNYKSSSKIVKEIGFENFMFGVISEYETFEECYWSEQEFIKETVKEPLSLNRSYYERKDGSRIFSMSGKKQTKEHIAKRFKNRKKPERSKEFLKQWGLKMAEINRGTKRGPISEEKRKKISDSRKGQRDSDEVRLKKSLSHKGMKKPWVKGTPPDKIEQAKKARMETISKKSEAHIKEDRKKISEALKGKPKNYKTVCSNKFLCRLSDRKELSKPSACKIMKDIKHLF